MVGYGSHTVGVLGMLVQMEGARGEFVYDLCKVVGFLEAPSYLDKVALMGLRPTPMKENLFLLLEKVMKNMKMYCFEVGSEEEEKNLSMLLPAYSAASS